jgi:tetratricopeptide (TPR) repeat protein
MERANDLYSTILAHGPSPSTLLIILQRMKEEGRTNETLRACIRGLRLYPDDIRIHRMLAECYLELGFFSLAEQQIALAVENIDKLASVFVIQAGLLERQGRREEAATALEKYLAHFPGDAEVIDRLRTLEQGEKAPSMQAPSSEEIVPEIATHTLAEIYESQGQFKAAVETYRRLIEQNPEDLRAHEHLRHLEQGVRSGLKPGKPPEKEEDGAQRMIGILEGWLAKVQEMGSA